MAFTPWQFTDPFIAYTPILAEEMNPQMNGISASFKYVGEELNSYRPRLPSNFTGNVAIPDGSYENTLLGINFDGDLELVDQGAFKAAGDKDFNVIETQSTTISVGGDQHANWYVANDDSAGTVLIVVGQAVTEVDDIQVEAKGASIIFTQGASSNIIFSAIEGVRIITPGSLKAFGPGSTVCLMAINQSTWVLGGDVLPSEVVIDD